MNEELLKLLREIIMIMWYSNNHEEIVFDDVLEYIEKNGKLVNTLNITPEEGYEFIRKLNG